MLLCSLSVNLFPEAKVSALPLLTAWQSQLWGSSGTNPVTQRITQEDPNAIVPRSWCRKSKCVTHDPMTRLLANQKCRGTHLRTHHLATPWKYACQGTSGDPKWLQVRARLASIQWGQWIPLWVVHANSVLLHHQGGANPFYWVRLGQQIDGDPKKKCTFHKDLLQLREYLKLPPINQNTACLDRGRRTM